MSDYRDHGPEYSDPYGSQPQPPQGGPQPYPPGYEQEAQQYQQYQQAPYGSQPHGQQPYAQQPYPYSGPQYYGAPMLPEPPNATTVFVLGILGLVVAGILCPFAWWQGNKARRQIRQGLYRESGLVTAGWIMGIIGSVILIIGAAIVIFYLILALWVWTSVSPG